MSDCCGRAGYDQTFDDGFARRLARQYVDQGLDKTEQRLVDFLVDRGVEGCSVLEIGGGVGELQVELLRRGAATATNLEISASYEPEARRLLASSGLSGRATRRIHDIAVDPDAVDEADVVLLHRVVCCYPDHVGLLTAAARHARRMLVFSHPAPSLLSRAAVGFDNLGHRLRRNPFRAFVHDPRSMLATLETEGLEPTYHHRTLVWHVVGLERR